MSFDDGGPAFNGDKIVAWYLPGQCSKFIVGEFAKIMKKNGIEVPIIQDVGKKEISTEKESYQGMSLRDYYAGQAMTNPKTFDEAGGETRESAANYLGIEVKDYVAAVHFQRVIAKACYEYADALIARKRETEKDNG